MEKAPEQLEKPKLLDEGIDGRVSVENGNLKIEIHNLGDERTGIWIGDKTRLDEQGNGRIEYLVVEQDGSISSKAGSSLDDAKKSAEEDVEF